MRQPDFLAGRVGIAQPGKRAGVFKVQVGADQPLRGVPQAIGREVTALAVVDRVA